MDDVSKEYEIKTKMVNSILRCCLWYHLRCEHLHNYEGTIMYDVSKVYGIKTKMVHEQWLPQKMLF